MAQSETLLDANRKAKILQESFTNLEAENIEDKENSSKWNSNSFCPVSIFEEENEVQPVNTELQVSEQHSEIVQQFILQPTETNTECHSHRLTILSK